MSKIGLFSQSTELQKQTMKPKLIASALARGFTASSAIARRKPTGSNSAKEGNQVQTLPPRRSGAELSLLNDRGQEMKLKMLTWGLLAAFTRAVTTATVAQSPNAAVFVDIDHAPLFSDANHQSYLVSVQRGDGTYETYTYNIGVGASNRELLASDGSVKKNPNMRNLLGQAFAPFANQGDPNRSRFAFVRQGTGDWSDSVFVSTGSYYKWNSGKKFIDYAWGNVLRITGVFVDIDYSPEHTVSGQYNSFIVTVVEDEVYKSYVYNTVNGTVDHTEILADSDGPPNRLLDRLAGQAFGFAGGGKNDENFAFVQQDNGFVRVWSGKASQWASGANKQLRYFQRNQAQFPGEFIDIDFSPELSSTTGRNVYVVTVLDNGLVNSYKYSNDSATPDHGALVSTSADSSDRRLGSLSGQAFGYFYDTRSFAYATDTDNQWGIRTAIRKGNQRQWASGSNTRLNYPEQNRFIIGGN